MTICIASQVLAAVSNKNIFHMLQLYVDGFQKGAKIPNSMVVALDEPTAEWCKARDVAHYTKVLTSRTGSTDNHATSGLKFKVLVDFLTIGCSVLLSDVDVLWMTNPFPHLYRDADVEGMSDGWDEKTAFGHNAGGGTVQLHARNSGMFASNGHSAQARSGPCSPAAPPACSVPPSGPEENPHPRNAEARLL